MPCIEITSYMHMVTVPVDIYISYPWAMVRLHLESGSGGEIVGVWSPAGVLMAICNFQSLGWGQQTRSFPLKCSPDKHHVLQNTVF